MVQAHRRCSGGLHIEETSRPAGRGADYKRYFWWGRRWIVEEVARLCREGAVQIRPDEFGAREIVGLGEARHGPTLRPATAAPIAHLGDPLGPGHTAPARRRDSHGSRSRRRCPMYRTASRCTRPAPRRSCPPSRRRRRRCLREASARPRPRRTVLCARNGDQIAGQVPRAADQSGSQLPRASRATLRAGDHLDAGDAGLIASKIEGNARGARMSPKPRPIRWARRAPRAHGDDRDRLRSTSRRRKP